MKSERILIRNIQDHLIDELEIKKNDSNDDFIITLEYYENGESGGMIRGDFTRKDLQTLRLLLDDLLRD